MKPRKAQERHTHDGIGSVGKGLRAFQIAPNAGDDFYPGGGGSNDLINTNISTEAVIVEPDLSSGLALMALRSGYAVDSTYGPRLRSYSTAYNPTVPLWLEDGDIRIRWRFGSEIASQGVTSRGFAPWTAMVGGFEWGDPVSVQRTGDANIHQNAWQRARQMYTVSGGALVEESWGDGFGSNLGYRWMGVGPSGGPWAEIDGDTRLWMVFKTHLGVDACNDHAVDLGIDYEAENLITWDITVLEGADVAQMKVWSQRYVTDTPDSVEFEVPVSWLPWGPVTHSLDVEGEGEGSFVFDTYAYFYNSVAGTWRRTVEVIGADITLAWGAYQLSVAPVSGWPLPLVVGDTGPPNYTPIYEGGPYSRLVTYVRDASGSLLGSINEVGASPSGADYWSGATPGATAVGFGAKYYDPSGVALPNPTLGRHGLFDGPDSQSELIAGSAVLGQSDEGNNLVTFEFHANWPNTPATKKLYWSGFLMPRPTDDYNLFGY